MDPTLLRHEQAGDEAPRGSRDEHLVGCGELLHACRHVHRFAEHPGLSSAALADHDLAGVHADPDREPDAMLLLETPVERHQRVDDRDPRAHAPLRTVVVNEWIAEVREEPVAEELCDVAAETLDRRGAAPLALPAD